MIVAISVFSLFHPAILEIQAAHNGIVVVQQSGQEQILEGSAKLLLRSAASAFGRDHSDAAFVLSVPGKITREFHGQLEVREEAGHLLAIVRMDREVAVASIVAAESPPSAPLEARKAQAVVARSFLTAARGRHTGFDFCDTTHCQFLRETPLPANPSALAAEQTRGLLLRYQGRAVAALYSANCGGKTRSLEEAGWNAGFYPYFGVACPIKGPVSGHRIGMCQEGAAQLARQGRTFREILSVYFPATTLDQIP
jgi:stage II sporulation protein D